MARLDAWRLVAPEYAASALSGIGAQQFGGRWNHRGSPAVYLSATASLALLEMVVSARRRALLVDYAALRVRFPDDLEIEAVDPASIDASWRDYPSPPSLKDFGTEWLASQRSAVLAVPSAVVPIECNYLINPLHPAARQIEVAQTETLRLDPRLL